MSPLLPLLLLACATAPDPEPRVRVDARVVLESPTPEPAAPTAEAPARSQVAPRPEPARAPRRTPAVETAPEATAASAPETPRVSRALFVVQGPVSGLEVSCGTTEQFGTRSVRLVDFPAGSCEVRARAHGTVYSTRVAVVEPRTVDCRLAEEDLHCGGPTG